MVVPRLTGTLRAFSGVSTPRDNQPVDYFRQLEAKRKEVCLTLGSGNGLSWAQLKDGLHKQGDPSREAKLGELLRDLKKLVRNLAGTEMPSDTVDDATVLIFRMFHGQPLVEQKDLTKLKQLFGPVQLAQATAACDLVHAVVDLLSPEAVETALSAAAHSEELGEDFCGQASARRHLYGQNFKLGGSGRLALDIKQEFPDLDYDTGGHAVSTLNGFSMKYEPTLVDAASSGAMRKKGSVPAPERRDFSWMNKLVISYFDEFLDSLGEEGVQELCSSVYQLLCSGKSNDELQYELIELLGFGQFELIEKLLMHRPEISQIAPAVVNAQSLRAGKPRHEFRAQNSKLNPSLGLGICVQSEQEKSIRKWVRKEEKKLQKVKDVEAEEDIEFDPVMLRTQRESALMAASMAPLFSKRERATPSRPVYPNVYDSSLDAKNTAGFIAGAKLLLPTGFDRKTTNMYEEVEIPPPEPAPLNVPKKLVDISSLDAIGQLAFEGIKTLNRMQSIVFNTAYHSNENLLICAPTGAGKTNIALLCIVREIKQNIEEGKILLDKFKIVYVAPMKALAAEMVANFSKRLQPLGVKVRELTGDMQLTKSEIKETQILVTTPEKWDVVTRKATGDVALAQLVKLLIIDEVHLLHGDRGPVLESLVARTLRQVEVSQSMIRLLGLSATLPGYEGVARFLNVNPFIGLFYFDSRFRPVPLGMSFVGVKSHGNIQQMQDMDTICYERVLKMVTKGHQVMVFVHARNGTVRTATVLRDKANAEGDSLAFSPEGSSNFGAANKQVMLSRNKQLRDLFPCGFAFHHAGMLRQDRNLVERMFSQGFVKVLVCTATLAWGVNLPAHAVIIRGTELYDATRGAFVDLGILDVMQIFGRAGRPQFDTSGHGTILTTYDKLAHYLSLLTCQYPIESQFVEHLSDNLNAEVALGTVTNVDEAVHWLSYTYLYVRLFANPHVYGLKYDAQKNDPNFIEKRTELIVNCARELDKLQMIRFDERTNYLHPTDMGRTASHFYVKHATVEVFNEHLKPIMTDAEILAMVSKAEEFNQLKIRDDEMEELDFHIHDSCALPVAGGSENTYGKVNILIQTYISRRKLNSFSLISDQAYVVQNATRIIRSLFEIVLRKNWPLMAGRLLSVSKVLEKQLWAYEHPLRQIRQLKPEILEKLENRNLKMDVLKEMPADEIGHLVRHVAMGRTIKRCVEEFVNVQIEASIQPITRTVLRVHLTVMPDFLWNDHVHGKTAESFWIWVEDPDTNHMYHSEYCLLSKKQVVKREPQTLVFTIPIFEPLPTQYLVHAESDRWLGSSTVCAISFQHLILPERHPPQTDLLDLRPLPVTALRDAEFEMLYGFTHFNPIQTQIFHALYHTDCNVLLGAPTGSGKTIVAEIAMFRVFRQYPGTKVVYIAPLKALVRERMDDWKIRLERNLNKKIVELTGDVTPDVRAIESADVIVTTPEKWDGISRSWQTRSYVKSVSLIVIDEIHLLGEDRGPVLEVIVSRTNFISSHTGQTMRVIGLSTALANARDLADWLGIKKMGLYNFRPSVRPVPMEVHIQGFPGKHYCPRMATMNKPCFQAIRMHSPSKPVLIFVSSRRQTRLTALDLIAFLVGEPNPKQWLHMAEDEIDAIISGIKDVNLKLTLAFGIAIHHAGLQEKDRKTVETLFVSEKIQILIATATLAWGVNFPAHLVVVKGTEYYDGKTHRYVDFPITDVLQMIGRAGRPQFDDHGVAVVLVQDSKKHFYKKFLYEPFPVESSLLNVLPEHINAEVVAGTITSKQDAMDYLTWTYFFRRLLQNPSFYQLEDVNIIGINQFLSKIIEQVLIVLVQASCIEVGEDDRGLLPTTVGRIVSYYYLSHKTVFMFKERLSPTSTLEEILQALCDATEYEELPVRHNEDGLNAVLAKNCPIPVSQYTLDSPHTKAHLLFQAHFSRLDLPCTDYLTDLKSVLDQSVRILQAMIDIFADSGWLSGTIQSILLIQMVIQARWNSDNSLLMLPHIEPHFIQCFSSTMNKGQSGLAPSLPMVMVSCAGNYDIFARALREQLDEWQIEESFKVLQRMPIINMKLSISGRWDDGRVGKEFKPLETGYHEGKRPDSHWVKVHADQEYCINVDMRRSKPVKRNESRVHAPKFSKPKDEGWILVLGHVEARELLALKRVGFVSGHNSSQLVFFTPNNVGRVIYTLYLLSDSYIGLDQQYEVYLDVIPASISAQVNTEVTDEDFGAIPSTTTKFV